jgi:hypothetical protein
LGTMVGLGSSCSFRFPLFTRLLSFIAVSLG